MSKSGFTVETELGSITVEGDALSALVITAAERVEGARVRRPRRSLALTVANGTARVELELTAGYGLVLPTLAKAVQAGVAEALRGATGLAVEAVDVSIEQLHNP